MKSKARFLKEKNITEFLDGLRQRIIPSYIYLIYGDEEFLIEIAYNRLKKIINGVVLKYYGNSFKLEDFFREVTSFGLFEKRVRKIFVIKMAEKLKKDILLELVEKNKNLWNDKRYLFLVSRDVRKWRNIELDWKVVQRVKAVFPPFARFKLWVQRELQSAGLLFSAKTLEKIVSLLPKNLFDAQNELNKIKLYFAKNKYIDADVVERVISPYKEENVFKMIDASLAGKTKEAIIENENLKGIRALSKLNILTKIIIKKFEKENPFVLIKLLKLMPKIYEYEKLIKISNRVDEEEVFKNFLLDL